MLAAMIERRVFERSLLRRLDPLWQDQQQQVLRNFLSRGLRQ
jgi:diphthamide synthase (EF-2-diphthine--ammonia ligase)